MSDRALAPAERRYESLVSKIVGQVSNIECANLKRYHTIGTLVTEFMSGLESRRYGSATVEKLAEDLSNAGALESIKNPVRFLYWAKALSDAYTDFAALEELGSRGFTVSHAKRLFALSPEIREAVQQRMIDGGRVVSTRVLDDLIGEITTARVTADASAAIEDNRRRREGGEDEATPAEDGGVVNAGVPSDEGDAGTDGVNATPDARDDSEDGGGDGVPVADTPERPEGVPATGRPARERRISNPVKVVSSFDKAITRANSMVSDVFIALGETAQEGFVRDSMFERWNEGLRSTRASAQVLRDALTELINSIDGEVGAAELPAQT